VLCGCEDEAEKCNCERTKCLANHLTEASVPHVWSAKRASVTRLIFSV
jgi:hypothetical protein